MDNDKNVKDELKKQIAILEQQIKDQEILVQNLLDSLNVNDED